MRYLHYKCRQVKKYMELLPDDVAKHFSIHHLLQTEKPDDKLFYIPFAESFKSFTKWDIAVGALNSINFPFDYDLIVFRGDDFDPVYDDYTDSFIISNMDKFTLDYGEGIMVYNNSPVIDKSHLRYCCKENVGDTEDRVADLFKIVEILVLLHANKLTSEQTEQLFRKIASIDIQNDLVVTKKYEDAIDFIDVFLQREKQARKILNRKYGQ